MSICAAVFAGTGRRKISFRYKQRRQHFWLYPEPQIQFFCLRDSFSLLHWRVWISFRSSSIVSETVCKLFKVDFKREAYVKRVWVALGSECYRSFAATYPPALPQYGVCVCNFIFHQHQLNYFPFPPLIEPGKEQFWLDFGFGKQQYASSVCLRGNFHTFPSDTGISIGKTEAENREASLVICAHQLIN